MISICLCYYWVSWNSTAVSVPRTTVSSNFAKVAFFQYVKCETRNRLRFETNRLKHEYDWFKTNRYSVTLIFQKKKPLVKIIGNRAGLTTWIGNGSRDQKSKILIWRERNIIKSVPIHLFRKSLDFGIPIKWRNTCKSLAMIVPEQTSHDHDSRPWSVYIEETIKWCNTADEKLNLTPNSSRCHF